VNLTDVYLMLKC